jgi:hypothetical protein
MLLLLRHRGYPDNSGEADMRRGRAGGSGRAPNGSHLAPVNPIPKNRILKGIAGAKLGQMDSRAGRKTLDKPSRKNCANRGKI